MRHAPVGPWPRLSRPSRRQRRPRRVRPWSTTGREPTPSIPDTSSSSFVTLTDEPLRKAAGSSDIVATNLNVFSDADRTTRRRSPTRRTR